MRKLLLILLAIGMIGCKSYALKITEKGKCVGIDGKWAYFEIEYNCKMAYPCVKSAYARNTGGYKIGKMYRITQIRW